jgi:serine/threonine protein kinase
MVGRLLGGRYRVIDKIGEGGMAIVYKAQCTLLNRIVAVKVLKAQYGSDSDFVERFRREAQSAASLSHPNIVNVYDVGNDNGSHYIVMEYVRGRSLKDIVKRGAPLRIRDMIAYSCQILLALDHAHSNSIVHRDIKPHNIIVTDEGDIKVTDFGIARATNAGSLTEAGVIMGTVAYFSPEQAKGRDIGPQSDIYSLGIVTYEMLTGRVPFRGDSAISVALQHIQDQPRPPSRINAAVPKSLERVVLKALAKDPRDRYVSAMAMLEDLRSVEPPDESLERRARGAREMWAMEPDEAVDSDQEAQTIDLGLESQVDRSVRQALSERRSAIEASPAFESEAQSSPVRSDKPAPAEVRRGSLRRALLFVLAMLAFLAIGFAAAYALKSFFEIPEVSAPDLMAKHRSEAERLAGALGLKIEIINREYNDRIEVDHVLAQSPAPGTPLKRGNSIKLTISNGIKLTSVPNVLGMSRRDAEVALSERGLSIEAYEYEYNDSVPRGRVIAQEPESARAVAYNSGVRLLFSSGPRPESVVVPSVIGLTAEYATQLLEESGLEVTHEYEINRVHPDGTVSSQKPEPGEEVQPGMAVVLTIAKAVGAAGGTSESAVPAAYQKVTYTVASPEGAREDEPAVAQLIEIRVKDFYGTTIPYTRWHKPGDVIVQPILVHGDWTIQVCQDGAVVLEQKGTVN